MARGFDELVEFLLEEIALCGVPGASSADFRRFVQKFYEESHAPSEASNKLEPAFYSRAWEWLCRQKDVRLRYRGEARSLSLDEFEAFEKQENAGTAGRPLIESISRSHHDGVDIRARFFNPNFSFRQSLQQRLKHEGHNNSQGAARPTTTPVIANRNASGAAEQTVSPNKDVSSHDAMGPDSHQPAKEQDQVSQRPDFVGPKVVGTLRGPRKVPRGIILKGVVFEDPDPAITSPRIYVSQNRMWQALTGHEMDYRRVSSMQLMLLSIIAAHGKDGILQPDLVKLSGQDKRSVPGRTDELKNNGYIAKIKVNKGMSTSLCIHQKYVKDVQFAKASDRIEDVFHEGTLIMSNFVRLLYSLLQENEYFPMRELRPRLKVSLQQWHGRAIRSAIYRLEESGFLVRKRVVKNDPIRSYQSTPVVLQLLRPPNDEDLYMSSSKRRKVPAKALERILEEDEDGDDIMRDLDLDLDAETADDVDTQRIPPQWNPDRLLSHQTLEIVQSAGIDGCDSNHVRDKTIGKFWKRPSESHLSRLTDNWEISQPPEFRHLAIIRDTSLTEEKKFLHYLYRTHGYFQSAVDAGYVEWEPVSKEAAKQASNEKRGRPRVDKEVPTLNEWGFPRLGFGEFHRRVGSSTLIEARTAAAGHRGRNSRVWTLDKFGLGETSLARPARLPSIATKVMSRNEVDASVQATNGTPTVNSQRRSETPTSVRANKQLPVPLLSKEQRIALGLPARGRLGADVEEQIRAHRARTGDPRSLPGVIVKDNVEDAVTKGGKKKYRRKPQTEATLFTKEFRRAHGLPENGRLKQSIIDHYRQLEESNHANDETTDVIQDKPDLIVREKITPACPSSNSLSQPDSDQHDLPQASPMPAISSPSLSLIKRKASEDGTNAVNSKRRKVDTDTSTSALESEAAGDPPAVDVPMQDGQETAAVVLSRSAEAALVDYAGPYRLAGCDLTSDVKRFLEKFLQRDTAGVYLDPLAVRTGGRGRPRKAFLVVIKSARLSELDLSSAGTEVRRLSVDTQGASTTAKSPMPEPTVTHLHHGAGVVVASQQSASTTKIAEIGSAAVPRPSALTTPIDPEAPQSVGAVSPSPAPKPPTSSWTPINVPITSPQADASFHLNALPAQHIVVPPLSPDSALGVQSPLVPPSQSQQSSRSGSVLAVAASIEDGSEPPEMSVQPDSYNGAFGKRGVVLGRGNVWHKRTHILLEIIKRCDGVFPNNGEMNLPFDTLWDQTYGKNMAKPDRTTILSTVKKLITPPYNTLKRVTFRIPSVHGPVTLPGRMLVLATIPLDDPRIRELQKNMTKAHPRKYYPEAIKDLCAGGEIEYERKVPLPIVDPSIDANTIFPPKKPPPPRRTLKKAPGTEKAASTYSLLKPQIRPEPVVPIGSSGGRPKRQRLETLNDGFKLPGRRRITVTANGTQGSKPRVNPREESPLDSSSMDSDSSEDIPLALIRPTRLEMTPRRAQDILDNMSSSSDTEAESLTDDVAEDEWSKAHFDTVRKDQFVHSAPRKTSPGGRHERLETRMLNPDVEFYPRSGTFSTRLIPQGPVKPQPYPWVTTTSSARPEQSGLIGSDAPRVYEFVSEETPWLGRKGLTPKQILANAGAADLSSAQQSTGKRKRVHFADMPSNDDLPARAKRQKLMPGLDVEQDDSQDDYQEDEEMASESEDDLSFARSKSHNGKSTGKAAFTWKKKVYFEPTLTERLSGLTGNPDDPVYTMPKKKRFDRGWRLPGSIHKGGAKTRKVIRDPSSFERFPKLCFTLVIASCMLGDENVVDWSIVAKVYRSEPSFSLAKAKKMWAWMQQNMSDQIKNMKDDFQTRFLDAYAAGTVDSIDDPNTHDWEALVRWAMRACKSPQLQIPKLASALTDYFPEESPFGSFDAVDWNVRSYTYVFRAQRAVDYAYASPIHRTSTASPEHAISRARSWVRSNTSTPQDRYSGPEAHAKFKQLNENLLQSVVNDMVERNVLRMRKIKKLLPGRNFEFPVALATKYRRIFETDVFTKAAALKASLDQAFANADPEKRKFTLSRTATDGEVMAVLSLVNDGRIKMVPKPPRVDNNLQARSPRVSVWGFRACHYQFRNVPREQLFWNLEVEPTPTYQFGNPLNPSPSPLQSIDDVAEAERQDREVVWKDLKDPPLPGKHDKNALLPIWSSFDGQHITWPWWYRILNLVVQASMFQPGVTASEIHRHCTATTTELFEVELVLAWLVDVGAASQSEFVNSNGEKCMVYASLPGIFAVFGKEFRDSDKEDWFGEKVKRKKDRRSAKETTKYNLRFQRVDALMAGQSVGEVRYDGDGWGNGHVEDVIMEDADADTNAGVDMHAGGEKVTEPKKRRKRKPKAKAKQTTTGLDGAQDVEMRDADGDGEVDLHSPGEGYEEEDAEGSVDEDMS